LAHIASMADASARPNPPLIEIIKHSVGERHLDQLSQFELVANPLENLPIFADFNDLIQWTKDSQKQITAGIKNRVYGGKIGTPIDFNNAFMAFMESAAMYLRDSNKVIEASIAYRSDATRADAYRLLEESTSQIDQLAAMWGMSFVQICDFVELHPDGHRFLVGPFCGAFIPKDITGNSPFIGVAFKGTNVTWEIINDLSAMWTLRPTGYLWETEVSSGFYYPLFSSYKSDPKNVPILLIQKAVQDIVTKATTTVITHVTGHSLGGAYSSLTYAQLTISGYGTSKAALGDIYTFGSPRVGRGDFAEKVKASVNPPMSVGSSWRIANDKDYVPQVPASPPWPISRDPFIHIDAAYAIFPNNNPTTLPSEIGKHPTWVFPTALSPHYTTEYYKSLTYATTQHPPKSAALSWGRYPLAVSSLHPANISSKKVSFDDTFTPGIVLQNVRDCVVGTIEHNVYHGDITAVGNIKALTHNASFHYCGTNAASLKALYSKENQCIFSLVDRKTLEISFFVDGVRWARARVSPANDEEIGNFTLTRGTCFWTFVEHNKKLADIVHHIEEKAANIFD